MFINVKLGEGNSEWATCGRRDKKVGQSHNTRQRVRFYSDSQQVYTDLGAINVSLF
jgi:hypothetical protein